MREFCSDLASSGRSESELQELGRQFANISNIEREETEQFYESQLAEMPVSVSNEIMAIAEALPATTEVKFRDYAEYTVRAKDFAVARFESFCQSLAAQEDLQ
jgi:hypothetical protein